jgi:8-oxo-dGTP pyrophosphatase MutT (NUDIX family)
MNDLAGRLLERLRKLDNLREAATVRPRDAATMIIIDRAGTSPKVLVGRRHAGHKFMPGKFVFPGGRVEPLDGRMPSATSLEPQVEARLMRATSRPSAVKARAFVLAAIRETFEETGILLGTKSQDPIRAPMRSPGGAWDAFVQ